MIPGAAWLYYLCEPETGEVRYVGWTSKKLRYRLGQHIADARRGRKSHRCNWIRFLLSSGNFPTIRPVAIIGADQAPATERRLIRVHKDAESNLVNGTDGGEGALGAIRSEETRKKIGAAARGRRHSLETRTKLSVARRRRHIRPETRAKMSALMRGRKNPFWERQHASEAREKMSAANRGERNHHWGKHYPPEVREKVAASKRGERNPNWGRPLSAETRQKLSIAITGKRRSAETRARMSAAQLRRFERERACA
jgi:hypothetical protein